MADLGVGTEQPDEPRSIDAVATRLVSPELTLVAVPEERLSS
jgi:hypothetical protein